MILIIYSGNKFQQNISQCLSKHSFLYDAVSNFQSAESLLKAQHYSLVIVESHGNIICLNRIKGLVDTNPESWVMAVESDAMTDDVADEEVDDHEVHQQQRAWRPSRLRRSRRSWLLKEENDE